MTTSVNLNSHQSTLHLVLHIILSLNLLPHMCYVVIHVCMKSPYSHVVSFWFSVEKYTERACICFPLFIPCHEEYKQRAEKCYMVYQLQRNPNSSHSHFFFNLLISPTKSSPQSNTVIFPPISQCIWFFGPNPNFCFP